MTATRDARLTAGHLARSAIVYIRQSGEMQVRNNVERRKLQYALADHARVLGFAKVELIDDDLGISGDGVHRPGFERLLQAVCSGRVGLVLAIEASRLARNGRDWHALLEICAVVGCLVGDRDRIYDPATVDDRAFLGLKGQFADMELAIFRQRSLESREALAGRGELFLHLPAGFEKIDRHSIEKTPDQHQRDAIGMVFRKFPRTAERPAGPSLVPQERHQDPGPRSRGEGDRMAGSGTTRPWPRCCAIRSTLAPTCTGGGGRR